MRHRDAVPLRLYLVPEHSVTSDSNVVNAKKVAAGEKVIISEEQLIYLQFIDV